MFGCKALSGLLFCRLTLPCSQLLLCFRGFTAFLDPPGNLACRTDVIEEGLLFSGENFLGGDYPFSERGFTRLPWGA